jgi:hypothetical protein
MARKSAIRISNAEIAAVEYAKAARRDQLAAENGKQGIDLLHRIAAEDRRERLGLMAERDLLKRAADAARLELRGASFSPDDRQDVAAQIVADVLEMIGGGMPRHDDRRVSLTALCDRAKTLRRSIERQRARDDISAQDDANRYATSAAALGIDTDETPAERAALLAAESADAAAHAASALCRMLRLAAEPDSAVWCHFYVLARGKSPEDCAAERAVSWGAWRVRMSRGAKLIRAAYSATELVRRLTLGAQWSATGELIYVREDRSAEAGSRTRMLADVSSAEHWRDYQPTDSPITERELPKSERVHHVTARKRRGSEAEQAQQRADSLRRIGAHYARESRRERSVARTSALKAA